MADLRDLVISRVRVKMLELFFNNTEEMYYVRQITREIKEEIGLDIVIEGKIGENEYVATHPAKGKTLKKVVYFLAKSEYKELALEKSGGLDGARWFHLRELPELRIYNDIIPLISKAVEIISKNNKVIK